MRITGAGTGTGEPEDRQESKRLLTRAIELGVNFIDTADFYGPHESERLIGEALAPYPDELIIATKGGAVDLGSEGWRPDGSPEHLRRACEGSLRIASVQNNYSITQRDSEDVLVACEKASIAFLPWHPMARGDLARPGGPLDQVAKEHDATPGQVALAWLLHRSPVMLPIPGTSSVAHLEENVGARDLELSGQDLATVEAAVEAA